MGYLDVSCIVTRHDVTDYFRTTPGRITRWQPGESRTNWHGNQVGQRTLPILPGSIPLRRGKVRPRTGRPCGGKAPYTERFQGRAPGTAPAFPDRPTAPRRVAS